MVKNEFVIKTTRKKLGFWVLFYSVLAAVSSALSIAKYSSGTYVVEPSTFLVVLHAISLVMFIGSGIVGVYVWRRKYDKD